MKKYYYIYLAVALCLHTIPATAWAQEAALDVATDKAKPEAKKAPDKTEKSEGDTYNFYFQKGPGPGSVEQGSGQQKVDDKSARSHPDFPWFEPQAALILSDGGAGISLGGQFNFSRTLGLQVHLLEMDHQVQGDNHSSFSASGTDDVSTSARSLGGSVALAYTPTTFNASVMPVRVSALLGAMILSTTVEETHSKFSAFGSNDWTESSKSTRGLGFIGVQGTAYLGGNWGAFGFGKLTSDPHYSQVGIGISYAL